MASMEYKRVITVKDSGRNSMSPRPLSNRNAAYNKAEHAKEWEHRRAKSTLEHYPNYDEARIASSSHLGSMKV